MMHLTPQNGLLAVLLAAACTTPRRALLLLLLYSTLSLLAGGARRALSFLKLPVPTAVFTVLTLGIGSALCLTLSVLFHDTEWLFPTLPLALGIITLAGTHGEPPPFRFYPILLLSGVVREMLASGSLWGITLMSAFAPSFGNGVGGLLVAALLLWLGGVRLPILAHREENTALTVLPLLAFGGIGGVFTRALSPLYAVFLLTAVAAFVILLCRHDSAWLCLVPLAAMWARESATVLCGIPLLLGAAALLLVPPLCRRITLAAPPVRFSGAPLTLTLTAVGLALSSVI